MDRNESLCHLRGECKYAWCLGQQARDSARVQNHEAQWVLATDLALGSGQPMRRLVYSESRPAQWTASVNTPLRWSLTAPQLSVFSLFLQSC